MRASDRNQVRDELLSVIRSVRRRWRLRRLLGGLAATGGVALGTALIAVMALERVGDASPAAPWVRAAAGAAIALAVAWFLVRPLLRRVSDERVALYLEEHEPSLEAAVLSALEDGDEGGAVVSDALLLRTLETAVRRCHATDDGRWIERGGLIRGTAALVAVVVAGGLLGFFPGTGDRAARLFSSPRTAEAAEGVAIVVAPGNATVSRGADAAVGARLQGFESDLVELAIRAEGDSAFDRLPMARAADGGFGYLLFDLDARTEYYVEAGGVRSPTFTLDVAELPYTRRLDLELVFPAYTGLPNRTVPDAGDVAALRGTRVHVDVTPTIPVTGGAIVVDDAAPIPLTADSAGTLTGEFTVRADGFYHITLDGPDGAPVEASPRYVVDAMSDGAPVVSIPDPGRDERATSIDEVYVEARAEDDYGVADLTLHWSVNGGEEQTEALYGGGGGLEEVSAGRTFYLEEYDLQPGDLVSYYATASDNDAVDGRKHATSDIYFIQIRPFERNFQASEQAQPPGGQQPGEGPDGDLSERQRQIIAGTHNLVRDSAAMGPGDARENLNTLALAQERLREQVETLAGRMVARQITRDTAFQRIAEILPQAAAEMDSAAARLRALEPGDALQPEQRALQHLQRAEAVFRDVQVGLGQQGGGGGGATPNAEDLADLFELELDKLRDQYETVDRGGGARDSTAAAVDETMERLEEIARRQQREAERRRREAITGRGTAGGDAQRQLAEEVEEEARRLERLSRDRSRPELGEAARRLRQTAESMRRSAAGGGGEERSVEGLRDARRMLERERGEGLRRQAESAGERAEEMAREQERIEADAERMLGTEPGPERQEQARRLEERKDAQLEDLDALQRELRDLAGQAGAEQPEAARRLRDAAAAIDQTQLRDRIEFSRGLAGGGAPDDHVRRFEDAISEGMNEVRDRLRGIGDEFRPGQDQQEAETLDRARDLARGLESVRERTRELREQGPGQPGEPGEPGERGEPGQPGAPTADGTPGGGGIGAGAVRQYRAEARERLEDARALGERLRERGISADEMDALVRGLEQMTRSGPYADAEELIRLQSSLADQAKRVELLLRVHLAGEEGAALFLTGEGAVPPEYRDLVEAYYRSLSRDDGGR